MPVLSIDPGREALLGQGSTKEGELKARFCLAWTSLCLNAPSSSCDSVESDSIPSKGEMQRCHCSWKGQESCILQGVPWGWGSFPEMWQPGKRQVAWWLCGTVTFALWVLAKLEEAASWQPSRDKQTAREKEGLVTRRGSCLSQATRVGLSGRGAS